MAGGLPGQLFANPLSPQNLNFVKSIEVIVMIVVGGIGSITGAVLGATSMSIHHKLCHTLGGSFNLPHADVHTVILPHATAYNREAAPEAMRRIADALGAPDAARGIYDLSADDLRGDTTIAVREGHAALVAGLSNGTLNPVVGRELPLAEAPSAHEAVMAPGALGKIVLVP